MPVTHRIAIAVTLACLCGAANAANYATCLLDKLPGLENDQAAAAANSICKTEYPGGFKAVPQGDGRGLMGYDSGAECALDKSGDTRSSAAAYMIRSACNRLYDKQCSSLAEEFGLSCE